MINFFNLQNIFIFEDTLKNNILLNNTDSGINDGEIFNLLKILKLDTLLTPGRNNGVHGMLKKVKEYARL